MPLAVSPDRRFLYASIRSIPYSVATYAINSATGALTHLSTVPLAADMDYISTDRTGRFLFSVSYSGAIITVNPIGLRGLVQPGPLQVIHTGSHPHAIRPDPSNRFVYVPVLGNDHFMQLVFNEYTGVLRPNTPPAVPTQKGAGPLRRLKRYLVGRDPNYITIVDFH